jgi:hypothetical protein
MQYRQAPPSRNAGLKEDSPQKNRKISPLSLGKRRQWKQFALLRTVLKNCRFLKRKTGAPVKRPKAAPDRATIQYEPFSKRKWRERRGSNPRPSA